MSKMTARQALEIEERWRLFGGTGSDAHDLGKALEALASAVKQLPKTADGVPITPGMKLWGSLGWNDEPATATLRGSFTQGYSVYAPEWGMNVQPEKECYSTRAAAEAARASSEVQQ